MKNLFPFQVNNAKALHKMFSTNRRLLLADETGLGKTYSTVLLIAMLALDKRKDSQPTRNIWTSHFNVLYICSNERIACKNMGELCKELCEKDLPKQAGKLMGLMGTQDTYPLMDKEDSKIMSARRNARLSIPMNIYESSYINLYNTTPETSFRVGGSAKVAGTEEERMELKKYNPACSKACKSGKELCESFAECRKKASVSNFNAKGFDLIILDEFQSFEDILSTGWGTKNKDSLYLEELLAEKSECKLLMLSATPYQTKASDLDSLLDFKRILTFLNPELSDPELSDPFDQYCKCLNDPNAKLSALKDAKKEFEKLFQQVCRRNQRSDVDTKRDMHSHIYGEQRSTEGLCEEFDACREVFSEDKEIVVFDTQSDEKNIQKLSSAMCQDTPWPASFAKGYILRKKLNNLDYGDKLYFQIDETASFLPPSNTGLQCTRILDARSLKVPAVWPNWKSEQVRRISFGDNMYKNLLKCIWLPPSKPDYKPDGQSPYAPFYENPPSKTIVFCEYMMTTRAIAAALSIEAVSGAGDFDLSEEEWQSLCLAPEPPTMDGHPYCCARAALSRVKVSNEEIIDFAAKKAAQELVAYLRRDEIRAVLQKAGVTDKKSLLQYCHDGNLTAVLEEYWSERRPELPNSKLFYTLYDAINKDTRKFGSNNQRENFEIAMRYIWKNRGKEIEGLKSYLKSARQTDVAFSALLGKQPCGFESSGSEWKEFKEWYIPGGASCNYSSGINTYAEYLFARYEEFKEFKKWYIPGGASCNYSSEINTYAEYLFARYKEFKEFKKWKWYIPGGASCNYSSGINTYAEYLFARYKKTENFEDQVKYFPPVDTGEISLDTLVYDQIRVCADILENGKTKLIFQKKYYSCSNVNLLRLAQEEEFECGRTGIRTGEPFVLGSQGLFNSSEVLNLWDACAPCSDFLPALPKSHVCIDLQNISCTQNECKDDRDGLCARIPLGFACRYTEDIQDTRDPNKNGAEQIAASFNSPFYPFVLLTSDVAKEGLSFHLYCRKLVHLKQTQRPAELIQRNGRVDRYHSLALRQRLANLANNEPGGKEKLSWEEIWARARGVAQNNAYTGMQPDWHLPARDGDPKIEIYYLEHPATFEVMKGVDMRSARQWYTQMLGSLLPDSLLEKLKNRYATGEESDLINAVKLNLCPTLDDLSKILQPQNGDSASKS